MFLHKNFFLCELLLFLLEIALFFHLISAFITDFSQCTKDYKSICPTSYSTYPLAVNFMVLDIVMLLQ